MPDEPDTGHHGVLLRLLRLTLPPEWADDIVRDMEEAHRSLRTRGRLRADFWLAGQVVLFGGRFALERSREMLTLLGKGVGGDALRQDVRHTLRSLRRAPVFSGAIVLTLAVGIGPNTAMFSVVNSVLLEPLPYPDSDRLVALSPNPWVPNEVILGVKDAGSGVEELAAFYPQQFAVTGAGLEPVGVEGAKVTYNFLNLFRAGLAVGRDFAPTDALPGSPRTAIISHGAWVRRHGGSPEVIGRVIDVNGEPHEIIGVTERGFRPLAPRAEDPELWIPFEVLRSTPDGSPPWAIPLARLSSTVPIDQSQTELIDAISRYEEQSVETDGPSRSNYRWTTVKSLLTADFRPALLLLQLSVGVLLLLASVNVANLLLVRFSARQSEVALRTALGASRGRLFRQLLTESLVLSGLGGVAGLVLMVLSVDVILAMAPEDVRRLSDISLDSHVLLFTLSVSIGTGLLFATVPALASTGQDTHQLLKDGGRTTTRSRRKHRMSQGLVIVEVTLTLVLVVGAGLLVRTFVSLSSQAPGFRSENVIAMSLRVPPNRYETVAQLDGFYSLVLERLAQVPGVEAVGLSNNLPISRGGSTRALVGERGTYPAQYAVVSSEYFRTLEIPLLRGRYLSEEDRRATVPVAVIDEAMWRDMWPDENPLGQRFQIDNGTSTWWTVVGVVGDIRGDGLARTPEPGFYISHQQRPDTQVELAVGHNVVFLSASSTPLEALSTALRRGIWAVDPGQPVPEITTLDDVLYERVTPQRFRALLLAAFATIALILAIAGMHGVVGQLLAERTHEFGVRQAMGATKTDLIGRVMGWGMRMTAVGLVLGVAGALAFSRFLTSMLFGVTPTDPRTLALSVAVVLAISLSACIGPALRATRIDPAVALRRD